MAEEKELSIRGAVGLHLMSGFGLLSSFWVSHHLYSIDLLSNPHLTLLFLWVIQFPIVILLFSLFRINPASCPYLKAVGRGIAGLLAGAVVLAVGAISLGAPIGITYLWRTVHWCFLMSLFTFAPAAAVYGSSWGNWQRIFGNTRPTEPVDFMVCLPAHGAILGSWFGAWPMPLDWERPWQEWPICVTYGALVGYTIGMLASVIFVARSSRMQHIKKE